MPVLTKALIRELEENAVKSGVSSFKELMYTAGSTAAGIILEKTPCASKKIAVLCGNGNNGGDGCVIARLLYEHGADVTVITPMGKPVTENATYYYDLLPQDILKTDRFEGEYDIIIDAVFGIGLNRELSQEISGLFERVNSASSVKIAVDIPSGVEADSGKLLGTAFSADFTITFIALKPCFLLPQGSDYCGEVTVADIGVEPTAYSYKTIERPFFKKRPHNAHKGTFGTALLLCGSYGMAGAAVLAAKGALRSGVGIAKCVLCESIYPSFTTSLPEAVCVPVKQSEKGTFCSDFIDIKALTEKSSALLFGCGVGTGTEIKKILKKILKESKIPVVLDADGINALTDCIELLKESKAPIIITPHPGEMARLCGTTVKEVEANRIEYACKFAKEYGCTVVLKGADTIVAESTGEISFNTNGNPGMATGGSGDVLAGITVSLLAQGFSPAYAAKAAVFLHGEAGDKAAARRSQHAMLPSDIIEEL